LWLRFANFRTTCRSHGQDVVVGMTSIVPKLTLLSTMNHVKLSHSRSLILLRSFPLIQCKPISYPPLTAHRTVVKPGTSYKRLKSKKSTLWLRLTNFRTSPLGHCQKIVIFVTSVVPEFTLFPMMNFLEIGQGGRMVHQRVFLIRRKTIRILSNAPVTSIVKP